jgi:hypothetical protein
MPPAFPGSSIFRAPCPFDRYLRLSQVLTGMASDCFRPCRERLDSPRQQRFGGMIALLNPCCADKPPLTARISFRAVYYQWQFLPG